MKSSLIIYLLVLSMLASAEEMKSQVATQVKQEQAKTEQIKSQQKEAKPEQKPTTAEDCPPEGMPSPAAAMLAGNFPMMMPQYEKVDPKICAAANFCSNFQQKIQEAKMLKKVEDYYLTLSSQIQTLKSTIENLGQLKENAIDGGDPYSYQVENLKKKLADAEADFEKYKAHLKDPKNVPHPMKAKGYGLTAEEKQAQMMEMMKKSEETMLKHMEETYKQLPQTVEMLKKKHKDMEEQLKKLESAQKKDEKLIAQTKDMMNWNSKHLKDQESDLEKYQAHLKDPQNVPHPMKAKGYGLTEEEKKAKVVKDAENSISMLEKAIAEHKLKMKDFESKLPADPTTDQKMQKQYFANYIASMEHQIGYYKEQIKHPEKMLGGYGGMFGGGFDDMGGSHGGYGGGMIMGSLGSMNLSDNTCTYIPSMSYSGEKVGSCGLSVEEKYAMQFYTGSGYVCLNGYLRQSEAKSEEVDLLVKTLNKALDKLPSYQGLVRRGATLPESVRKLHQVGNVVNFQGYTSTATSGGFGGMDMFVMYSKTGKPIMSLSAIPGENEVLFKSDTKFKVLDVTVKGSTNYYVMKEVSEKDDPAAEEQLEKQIMDQVKAARTPAAEPKPKPEMTVEESLNSHKSYKQPEVDKWSCPVDEKVEIPKVLKQVHAPQLGL